MIDQRTKTLTLVTVTVTSFLSPFAASGLNLALPVIGRQLHGSALMLSWAISGYVLASAAFMVPLGRLSDIIGRRRVFFWGQTIFVITSLLCGLSGSMSMLIMARSLEGIAAAAMFGTSLAILSSVFPPGERGRVLGINVGTVYAGLSLGPSLGGIMTHHLGWQWIFYSTTLVGAVNLALSSITISRHGPEERSSEPYAYVSAILYIVGLVTGLYGISSIASNSQAPYLLLVGTLVFIAFIVLELRSDYPLLNLRLFQNLTFAFSNLAALINYSATYAVSFIFAIYLQVVRGYDAQAAGMILLIQPAFQALLSPYAGSLSDRVEPRTLASLGMGVSALGLLIFSFISPDFPLWLLMANLALLGSGFGLFSSPNSNAVMGSVERRFYGVASSTLATMRNTGQAFSMALVTLIVTLYVGNAQLTPELATEFVQIARTACLTFAIICGLGIFASLARGRVMK